MRVLHVIPTLGPLAGGANVSCFELSRELTALGAEVTIFSTAIDIPPEHVNAGSEPVYRDGVRMQFFPVIGPAAYPVSIAMILALRRAVREFNVVHIHSLYRLHLPAAAHYCRRFGVPYVVKPHGSLDPYLFVRRRLRKKVHELLFDRAAYAGAAAIQFTAYEEMSLAGTTGFFSETTPSSGVIIPNGVVIPEGLRQADVNAADIMHRFPQLANREIVLFLGRINYKKGLDILVDAFFEVARRRPNATLVVAGPDNEGYANQVKGWLAERGVLGRALFTGMLHGDDKAAMFRAASVFVLSSYTENFGVAIVEAMSFRCPVVISNRVNIWSEISDAKAGLIVNCNARETADAILRVLEDPVLAENLRLNGYALVRDKYSWDNVARRMYELYERLIRERVQAGTATV